MTMPDASDPYRRQVIFNPRRDAGNVTTCRCGSSVGPGMFHSCKPVDHPKGWQCPVCGVVYAPTVPNCRNAHQPPST